MSLKLVSAALAWAALMGIRSTGWLILFSLPSTLAHELAHWAVALLTGSQPGLPSVLPRKSGKGWVLGSVSFKASRGRAALVGLAPLLILGPVAIALFEADEPTVIAQAVLQGITLAYLAKGCVPSSPDIRIALQDPVGLLIACGIVVGSYYAWVAPGLQAWLT